MTESCDPFDLSRFLSAQSATLDRALAELRAGKKSSHWMWFVFPQIRGLGASPMAQKYAIGSLEEARAYLGHPLLGSRLLECVRLVVERGKPIEEIFGYPDWLKFRSSVTLFAAAAPGEPIFEQALARCCAGAADPLTLEKLRQNAQIPPPAWSG
ncbi:DUF1810 domain-containing protein [Methylocystis heyeri]|uniref:DUF1810 family protein n=1 Tax=Methylocystis heyeri TaxID=391905 RepID=A0A6B8KAT1_9HYPH|nr:DUF1810 domain-containing protein [Methylocystis heyeri]QGM44939.1 DUF1810 family protein [Methylocystis heyeri]